MNNIIKEDPVLWFPTYNMNSRDKDTYSNKTIGNGNYFFFSIDEGRFKDSQDYKDPSKNELNYSYSDKNETNNSFLGYEEPFDDFINIFNTNSNTEGIEGNILGEFIIDAYPSQNHRKNLFVTKKKGRAKICENKNKVHDKHSLDNLLTKIQVHFLSFIIDLSNDALKAQFGEKTSYNFKHLPYEIKKCQF